MSSMLRQHHIKLQDLAKSLRGFDPAKTESAEDWSRIESATFEPGMLLFCLERVSAPQGLAFGKKEEGSESYRVRDLCVVVGRDNGRPLVVNITASAYELRFLEVLLLEKARKAILDSKEFLYVSAQPSTPMNEAKIREIEQLGAVYAQGGSRRTLVVDVNGPQEPAMALLGALGVKLQTGAIGKQVLDIGSVCHMLFTPETRQDDKNKQIVKEAFTPIQSANQTTAAAGAPDMVASESETVAADPGTPDLKFSFERTEISTDQSSWQQQQSGQGFAFPAQAPAGESAPPPAQQPGLPVDPYRNLNQVESAKLDANLLREFAASAEQNKIAAQGAQQNVPPPAEPPSTSEPDFEPQFNWQPSEITTSGGGVAFPSQTPVTASAPTPAPAHAQSSPGGNGGGSAQPAKRGSLFERLSEQFSKVMQPDPVPQQATAAVAAPPAPSEFGATPFSQQAPSYSEYAEPQFGNDAPPAMAPEPFFEQAPSAYNFSTEQAPAAPFASGDSYMPVQSFGQPQTSYGGMTNQAPSTDPFSAPAASSGDNFAPSSFNYADPANAQTSAAAQPQAFSGGSFAAVPPPAQALSGDSFAAVPPPPQALSGDSFPAVPAPTQALSGDTFAAVPQPNQSLSGDSFAAVPAANQSLSGDSFTAVPAPNQSLSGDSFAAVPQPNQSLSGDSFAAVPQPNQSLSGDSIAAVPAPHQSFSGDSFAAVPSPNQSLSSDSYAAVPAPGQTMPSVASGDSNRAVPQPNPLFSGNAMPSQSTAQPTTEPTPAMHSQHPVDPLHAALQAQSLSGDSIPTIPQANQVSAPAESTQGEMQAPFPPSNQLMSGDSITAVPNANQSFSGGTNASSNQSFSGDSMRAVPDANQSFSGNSMRAVPDANQSFAGDSLRAVPSLDRSSSAPESAPSAAPQSVPSSSFSGDSLRAVPQPDQSFTAPSNQNAFPGSAPQQSAPTSSFSGDSLRAVPQPQQSLSSDRISAIQPAPQENNAPPSMVPPTPADASSQTPNFGRPDERVQPGFATGADAQAPPSVTETTSPFSALSSSSELRPVGQAPHSVPSNTPAPMDAATISGETAHLAETDSPVLNTVGATTGDAQEVAAAETSAEPAAPQSETASSEPVAEERQAPIPAPEPEPQEEAPKDVASMQNSVFQEPKLVMSEMATLMNRLEQQVGKAGKKLNARAEEIRQRLNASVAQMVSSASEVEKGSQHLITTLTNKQTKKLDDVSEEVRLKVSDVASNGRYTIKQLLQSNQLQVEDEKTALYDSLRDVCKQFRVDTETLTKTSQAKLNKLVGDRTNQLEELVNTISERLNGTSEGYAEKLKARFDRFRDRMQEEAASVVRSLERNVRSMTEEIDGSWDRASDKLKSSKAEFELTINHTVRTSQLNISSTTRRILSETLIPKLRERKASLRNISNELGRRFAVESDRQANGQLLGLESSLGAARQQLQTLVEECISSIDTVGRAQQASLEEIFKETSIYAERATLEVVSILQKSETAIRETELACKSLAETSSLEHDAELMEVRNAASARVQQLRSHANQELNSAIDSGCARLDQLSQRVQVELSSNRLESTQTIRDAAEHGLTQLRDAIQEALSAIQGARDKYME